MAFQRTEGKGRKTDDVDKIAVEAEKTLLAGAIGRETGLFYVPEVLHFNEERGVLETEWIDGLQGLHSVAVQHAALMGELCCRAGAALGAVHKDLRLPEEMKVRLPGRLRSVPDADVFLHGDFNGSNVCYDQNRDRLVILDWSSAPLFGGKATFGPAYFDIVWFGHYFFSTRPGPRIGPWDPRAWFRSLIKGYCASPDSNFSEEDFYRFRKEMEPILSFSRRQMVKRWPRFRRVWRWVLLAHGSFHWNRFRL